MFINYFIGVIFNKPTNQAACSTSLLLSTLSKCLEKAVDCTRTRLQCRNNVLCRRLEQCDNVCDKLVLALEGSEFRKFVSTDENAFLSIGCFKRRIGILILLQQLRRLIRSLREHYSSIAFETIVKRRRADRADTFTLAVDRAMATSRVRLSRSLADSSREVL